MCKEKQKCNCGDKAIMRYISLDMLKTFAAIIIATGHFFAWTGQESMFPSSFVLACDFFFISSGFTLTNSIYRKNNMSQTEYCKNLIVSRITRLWVPYVLLAIIYIYP